MSDRYRYLIDKYGVSNFFDLYILAESSDNEVAKSSKKKDTSRLQLIKRTVMRNGQVAHISYYVDPNKNDSKDSSDDNDDTGESGIFNGGYDFGYPLSSSIALSKPPDDWVTIGRYRSTCYDYIFFVSDSRIQEVAGISNKSGYLSLVYFSANEDSVLKANHATLISKLIFEAWKNNLGIDIDNSPEFLSTIMDSVFSFFDIKLKRGHYIANAKELIKCLGDNSCMM